MFLPLIICPGLSHHLVAVVDTGPYPMPLRCLDSGAMLATVTGVLTPVGAMPPSITQPSIWKAPICSASRPPGAD